MIQKRLGASLLAGALFVAATMVQAGPTTGYTQYTNSYKVQDRTTHSGAGFKNSGGVFTTTVYAGDERCEMRWNNFPNQNTYNQFECDAMFDGGTQRTAIHQIKSNTGGEPIYLQVTTPGSIRNDNGSVFATGMANKWFHINSLFNPKNGDAKCYINGSLKVTRTMKTSDRSWYFKNGCYNNGLPSGGRSKASFKNIKHWRK